MELMTASMDKLYKRVYSIPDRRIPEGVIGKLTRAVSNQKCLEKNYFNTIESAGLK